MRVQIQKWGNSLAIRIPNAFAKETKIEQGSFVDLSTVEGNLVVKPVNDEEFFLEELLAGVCKENLHEEIDTGNPTGRELW